MPTQIHVLNPEGFDPSLLEEPARMLAEGGLVAFPTETVYGIAARIDHPEAIERLIELKQRPPEKPFSVHLSDVEQLPGIIGEVPRIAQPLIDRFWPGPLTIVFPVPDGSTVGVRLPANEIARALIRRSGVTVVAPSANPADDPPALDARQVLDYFDGRLDAVIDGGAVPLREASTVVRITEDGGYRVLRPGIVSERMIHRALRGRRILFVCTGNTCRSPLAAALACNLLARRMGIEVEQLPEEGIHIDSAGVAAFGGGEASSHSVCVLEEMGFTGLENHRSKPVTRELIEDSDLIIALGHGHRDTLLHWNPEIADRVHVISDVGVSDPIGGDLETYRRCALEIEKELESRWLSRMEAL
ncbi:MAG: L-threonylcarbamoyladenylate synthase [Planctomycetota bacterium]